MIIREEQVSDIEEIWQLNSVTFETDAEANLVNALRLSGCTFISLVAVSDNKIIGHILFTPVELLNDTNNLKLMGLAPMAVLNDFQKKGVGSALVKAGLVHCRLIGVDAAVVLGHSGYYPKFGFVPSVNYGINSEYDVPADVFMVLELKSDSLHGHKGLIKYHDAFNQI